MFFTIVSLVTVRILGWGPSLVRGEHQVRRHSSGGVKFASDGCALSRSDRMGVVQGHSMSIELHSTPESEAGAWLVPTR